MSLLAILAVIAAVLAGPAVLNLIRSGDIRRMGMRNIIRRPVESVLIIVGSALGTAIIVTALMVGDTFDHSIRDIARVELGEVDATITFDSADELADNFERLQSKNIVDLDGALAVRWLRVAAAGSGQGDERAVEPRISVASFDFELAQSFGSDPDSYGLVGLQAIPKPTDIVVNEDLAAELQVGIGDTVALLVEDNEISFAIAAIVEEVGLGGYADAFVSPEVVQAFDPDGTFTFDHIVLSATGTVFDSTNAAQVVTDRAWVAIATPQSDFMTRQVKQDLLDEAEAEGKELTQIFSVVGGFSVLAGVLLLINLFVMLAEERKPNLGVLRAIGWKQSALRRAFRAEGVIYALIASVIGTVLGIGVGWAIVRLTKDILAGSNRTSDFELQFTVRFPSLVTAGLIGLSIAMAAIWFTSWRISRLNIISAIRDLPEPRTRRSRALVTGGGVAAIVAGAALLAGGLIAANGFLAIVSVPLAALGVALLVKDSMSPLLVSGIAGAITVAWGALFFPIMPTDMTEGIDINFFLLFGAVIVAGGVAVTTVLGPTFQRLLSSRNRPMIEARVAMAYPSARMFRTAASLAMYSLIIFTLAFMAILANGLVLQQAKVAESTAAGHDIIVQSNRVNPIDPAEIRTLDGVTQVSPLIRNSASFLPSWQESSDSLFLDWPLVGIEPGFAEVGAPTLSQRAERFDSDMQALAAVTTDPSLVIVPPWFDANEQPVGQTLRVMPDNGDAWDLEIVGVSENDLAFSGVWMSTETALQISPHGTVTRLYLATDPAVDADAIASRVEARFLANGADAETFTARVEQFGATRQGFFVLLRGYLLLGLVIGIAGLAVTLFRAVRERRRQIGMMRAMGLPDSGVRRWFMIEATFISAMGILTGVGLGTLTGYLTTTQSTAFDGVRLPFGVPWAVLAFIIVVPFIASILAAVIPARRAARLRPSEALRWSV